MPSSDEILHRPRDREEEVADFARRVKGVVRAGQLATPARAALVVHQRLPYVYVAREVFRAAGVPCQMFDALPLAAEPFAAALDVVLAAVGSNFARGPPPRCCARRIWASTSPPATWTAWTARWPSSRISAIPTPWRGWWSGGSRTPISAAG